MGQALQGDLGDSAYTNKSVSELIAQRIPTTLELTLVTMVIVILIVVPLGLYVAYNEGSAIDRAVLAVNSAFLSIPTFVLGLTLVMLFAHRWDLFPVSGWVSLSESVTQNLRYLALPMITLALVESASLLQVFRSDVTSTLRQEHILLAQSKGLSTRRILTRHALRLSSLSLVTLLGLSFARLLGGAILVEVVFALPGLGSLLLVAIQGNDMVLVQGMVLVIGVSYLVINLLVDILYTWLDPRIRRA
jgi:peptide/nickel transport system permease protein